MPSDESELWDNGTEVEMDKALQQSKDDIASQVRALESYGRWEDERAAPACTEDFIARLDFMRELLLRSGARFEGDPERTGIACLHRGLAVLGRGA